MSVKVLVWTLILDLLVQPTVVVSFLEPNMAWVLTVNSINVYNKVINFPCNYFECCNDEWIKLSTDTLVRELEKNVYGQHLAVDVIARSLQEHTRNSYPEKALVLSMHGWVGTGKNYVSQFIIDHLYREGDKSKFVHLFVATKDFPHERQIQKYKDELTTLIKHKLQECPRSLFIFDEVDKMPVGLINAAIHTGALYRKAIFLLLSNTAGTNINKRLLEHLEAGHKREDLTLEEMEETIMTAALEENLWYNKLFLRDQISVFVPFLPLERHHVINCIRDEMSRKYLNAYVSHEKEKFVNMVADELRYTSSHSTQFSRYGCRPVAEKMSLILEDYSL